MGAPRRSTPPRSAGRGRNKPPVTRERTSRTRTGPQRRKRKSSANKSATRSSRGQRKASGGGLRSFLGKMAFMAVLGYALVLSVDVIPRLMPDEAGALWDKLVDRWLDNDVPRSRDPEAPPKAKKRAAKKKAPPKAKPAPAAAPKPAPVKKAKEAPRAEYEAPRPDAYARESRSLSEERARKAKQRRRRLNSLIDQVTSDL